MKIKSHRDLDVYQRSVDLAMSLFRMSRTFPKEEKYSRIVQIRRSGRSVCANIYEGFRKRRYPRSFMSKLVDAEGEAAETRTWLQFSLDCDYITEETFQTYVSPYERVIGKLVTLENQADQWVP